MNLNDGNLITTQLTSKRLKLQWLIAKVMIWVGIIMLLTGGGGEDKSQIGWGCLLALFGFGYIAINRIKTWWNHS